MNQDLYQKAMLFAGEKHKDQKVPGTNSNYLLHISNVAMEILVAYNNRNSFDVNFAVQVGILHDTLEDTDTNFEDIKSEFGDRIAIAVQALTKNESLKSKRDMMIDSLNRINELQKEVGIVKIADRITNLQSPPSHWSKEKVISYCEEAKTISKQLANKNEYLNERLELKIKEYEDNIN